MTQVPAAEGKLAKAIALADSMKLNVFGRGTMDEPLFDIEVQIVGRDGNAFSIIAAIDKAVRAHMRKAMQGREGPIYQEILKDASDGISEELMDSKSYDELLRRVMCTVHVY